MPAPFGRNLESSCKAWFNREATRLNRAVDDATDAYFALPDNSPDRPAALAAFVGALSAAENHVSRYRSIRAI